MPNQFHIIHKVKIIERISKPHKIMSLKVTIVVYKPIYSPFSRESIGQKDARMLCIRGVNLSEQRRVK